MERMTNVKAITYVLENCGELPTEIREKLEKIKTSFEKKSSGERKPSPTQIINEKLKNSIVEYLKSSGEMYSASDLMVLVPELAEIGASNQKTSALLKQLQESGLVEKVVEKRKSYFKAR